MFNFEFDEFFWIAKATLPIWAGFNPETEHFGEIDPKDLARGTVQVLYAPEGGGEEPLKESELTSVGVFFETHVEQAKAVLQGLFDGYGQIVSDFNDAYCGDPGDFPIPPEITSPNDFRSCIQLHTIHIHPIECEGAPYVGYEFHCDWEGEHGVGVLMHKNRVVKIGHSDSARLLWIAKRDAEQG